MLKPNQFFGYQRKAILHQLHHDESMLWLDMGLGKTPITLTSIERRIRSGQIKKCLVVGPIRVITAVWEREARKWEHTKDLSFSLIRGPEPQRLRALFREADIYLINYENLAWFSNVLTHFYLDKKQDLPFQMVVYDEVSKMKNSQAQRMKGGKRVTNKGKSNEAVTHFVGWKKIVPHIKFKTGLTGTPASNGYLDLFGQYLALDGGKRLGEYLTHFRDAFFNQNYNGFGYEVSDIGKTLIETKIADITIKMDSEDYLEIPPIVFNEIWVTLDNKTMKFYGDVERDMFAKLEDGTEIEVFNRASVSNKCLQIANGSAYKEPGEPEWCHVHDEKLTALEEVLEEASGSPVLVGYTFRMDAERIMTKLKQYHPVNLTTAKTALVPKILRDWEAGKIKLLLGHPASMGHGIDGLQESGHILVWFGLPWSLELYYQMIGRLKRVGQTKPVIIHQILAENTLDLAVLDALRRKATSESGLKDSIQRYRDGLVTKELSFL